MWFDRSEIKIRLPFGDYHNDKITWLSSKFMKLSLHVERLHIFATLYTLGSYFTNHLLDGPESRNKLRKLVSWKQKYSRLHRDSFVNQKRLEEYHFLESRSPHGCHVSRLYLHFLFLYITMSCSSETRSHIV